MKMKTPKIENIQWMILDAMGVVFKTGDDINELLIPYLRKLNPGIPADQITKLYARASLGEISSKQFWEELDLGNDYPGIERAYLDRCLETDPDLAGFVSAFKAKYRFGMLFNDVKEWSRYLRAKHGLDEWLGVAVISGEIRLRKPDLRIYEALTDWIKVDPSYCLFVDDRERNLIPAQKLGFQTILFSRQKGNAGCGNFQTVHSFDELAGLV